MTTMTPLQFGWNLPSAPTRVVPIQKGELRVINADPHNKKEKGLVPVPTLQGEIMWVNLDLIEGQQWTTVTNRKSRGKEKAHFYNVVCTSSRDAETDIASLTDLEEVEIVLAAKQNTPSVARTRSDQQYLKKYN